MDDLDELIEALVKLEQRRLEWWRKALTTEIWELPDECPGQTLLHTYISVWEDAP